MEKNLPSKRKGKKAGVAILISDKIDFKMKDITRDKESHYIILKGSIQQEDITLINIYAPNIGAPKYIRNLLEDFKGEINSKTIIAGNFNTPLTSLDVGDCLHGINFAKICSAITFPKAGYLCILHFFISVFCISLSNHLLISQSLLTFCSFCSIS
uniref:Endonuclease/exonuclease/phosphatase domain-containing protein n=1 Tax=Molossus molossus TaxID=27622 RepID=A0A7J8I9V1_MOLMO|nr:hypothetical protein HJG59_010603 [Molossus molossus]